jgi:serine/threonine protein kinase
MAQKIVKKILQNLNLFHTAGFIHRDIKPENILFDNHMNSFHLFLADFGLSVEKGTLKNVIGKKCSGTLGFVAP